MQIKSPSPEPEIDAASRLWPVILLTWVAGFVDALGYLALDKVFTAHMSGNSAAIGATLGSGNWHEALVRGLAIPGFVLGIGAGVACEVVASRACASRRLLAAFVLEIALLGLFIALDPQGASQRPAPGSLSFFGLVWLLALAMGVQNATLQHAGGFRIRTTYISGMLTNMSQEGAAYLLGNWKRLCGPEGPESDAERRAHAKRAGVFGLVFLAFLIGGCCGGWGEVRWGSKALIGPETLLVFLSVQDWFEGAPSKSKSPSR